jgi:hypothetical protein
VLTADAVSVAAGACDCSLLRLTIPMTMVLAGVCRDRSARPREKRTGKNTTSRNSFLRQGTFQYKVYVDCRWKVEEASKSRGDFKSEIGHLSSEFPPQKLSSFRLAMIKRLYSSEYKSADGEGRAGIYLQRG